MSLPSTKMEPIPAFDTLAQHISAQAFADEKQCVQEMLAQLAPLEQKRSSIFMRAEKLVTRIRAAGTGSGVEAFLHTYGLDTREGVAVMCLAEALLRIPDPATANRLIRDKFEDTHWSNYLGSSESLFVNASSWGLLLTGSVVNLGAMEEEKPVALLGKLVSRAGEPVIREALKAAMKFIGTQFVLGEDIHEALKKSLPAEKKGYRFSYDILGEGARNQQQAEFYMQAYRDAIAAIGAHNKETRQEGRGGQESDPAMSPRSGVSSRGKEAERGTSKNNSLFTAPSISVKLSALHPRFQLVKEERVMQELLPRLKELITLAAIQNITVSIDAEEAARLDIELGLFRALFLSPEFADYEGIGFVLQSYQKRAIYVVDFLAELSRQAKKRLPLRLVKGAYWDAEIKNAQMLGLPGYPVFTRKEYTDISYMACAQKIIERMDCFYPQFATHNALTVATIVELAGNKGAYEFQRLHGMGEQLHDQMVKDIPCRIYAPVGKHEDLLAYLIRRLLENGANTSFVNLLMDRQKPISELLEDPMVQAQAHQGEPNAAIKLPISIYSDRKNSSGFDLGNLTMLTQLQEELAAYHNTKWQAAPTCADNSNTLTQRILTEPADKNRIVGHVLQAGLPEVELALQSATHAFDEWRKTSVEARAIMLDAIANAFEEHRIELMALIMREAGRTLPDAISEVREAADFCRYYAHHARRLMQEEPLESPTGESNVLLLAPRGVFACISPWNFPLAIFTGQIVAALATANCAIAKPAEQTPLIAALAVKLLHAAGIPKDVVQLLPGKGSVIGSALTGDERIAGVVFTGSMEVAQRINRALASRNGTIAPLIAETGGQNCMIVDSSALLEQVCDDVLASAFGSAGQRCSALRVLYVQEEVADKLIALIQGAMQELTLGNPWDVSTDIGPVIDAGAQKELLAHIERMKQTAKLIAAASLKPELVAQGSFVAPHAFEIRSIKELTHEVFGPVLHIIRYKANDLEKICEEINSTGYGLTFGLQSRIEDAVENVKDRIHAGNIYVNRSMIGATVGVQPFGGEGMSGTGPKAGGPHYLLRFVTERTLTINTAALGGNLELLSKKQA